MSVLSALTALLALAGLFLLSAPVGAQDETGFTGTITVTDDEGERTPAEGIRFFVEDGDGGVVGEATTDAEGIFFITVSAGTYNVSIDTDSTGLTNFAHGELVTVGALGAVLFNSTGGFGIHIIIAHRSFGHHPGSRGPCRAANQDGQDHARRCRQS